MKKMMIALAAAAAGLGSVSGTAQAAPWHGDRHSAGSWSINALQAQLDMQIRSGRRSGALTRTEASQLRRQLESLERLERIFRRNGLSFAERRVLNVRFDALERGIRIQVADNQHRYGHNSRYLRH